MNTEGIKNSGRFWFIKVFNSGFLTIYDTQLATDNFVSVAKYPEIDTSLLKTINGKLCQQKMQLKKLLKLLMDLVKYIIVI